MCEYIIGIWGDFGISSVHVSIMGHSIKQAEITQKQYICLWP